MLVKRLPDLDASAAVFRCFGAVFEHSSTLYYCGPGGSGRGVNIEKVPGLQTRR
jgi:hypothetical protein